MRHQPDRIHAFTLVELLVVVAIIALLLAILLPALGKATATARNVDCMSRLNSVAKGVVAYTVDYRGRFPAAFGGVADEDNPLPGGDIGNNEYFTDTLEPYLDVGSDQLSDFYICPDSTLEPEDGQKQMSYSANPLVMINRQTTEKYVMANRIKRPMEVMALSDAAQNSGAGTSGPTFSGPFMGPFFDPDNSEKPLEISEADNIDDVPEHGYHYRFRHFDNTSGNAAFLDGHAESRPLGKVFQKNLATDY